MVLAAAGCGKKSGLEGKLVDGQGKPVTGARLIARQVQPIKGYEQFEATTASDGTFRFKKLFPTSEYILFPWFEDWTEAPMRTLRYEANKLTARFNKEGWVTEEKMLVQSGPEGQTILLKSSLVVLPTVSTVEGKVMDGKKKPFKNTKIIAKQVNPVSGYEQFETTTGSDGTFRFSKLYPDSKYYILIPGKTKNKSLVTTKGEQTALKEVLTIRFIAAKGVVTDSSTGLMWAAKDNGKNINWPDAKSYAESYKGGGYTDWRLPTQDELAGIYNSKKNRPGYRVITKLIGISSYYSWASETRGSEAAYFHFDGGYRSWGHQSGSFNVRSLPVRFGN